ncbi:MAG: 16S rRNA (cytosine(967)-C(5))-methyltransferase RsmB [Lawsonibacter sp.]|nr:16S rRNA (cytosine(967)-C(5))-methyltransferase RsmB [Lawsonibacter sp.]
MDARETALLALNDCQRQGGWSDAILKKRLSAAGLDSRDGALATQLCFGVVQNRMLLDFYLSHFSNLPLKRMEGKVVEALRLGCYQMLFLDKIPHSAAVNSSVELTRKHCKNPRAAGMVNGILRNLERSLDHLPTISKTDPMSYFSTLYSHPDWLVKEFLTALGSEETAKLLAANNSQAPITAMVNTTKTSAEALVASLEGEGVTTQPHPWLTDCLILSKTGNLERLKAFCAGLLYIQDPASKLAVLALDPQPGMRVLDCCAAPGGKSFAAAIQMEGQGEIISCDLHPHKKKLIQAGADRLGLSHITPMTADGKVFRPEWENAFDRVLVDAPCSGLGVIRKKPDIRYKDPEPLKDLPKVQRAILDNAARYVRPGGVLVYSTCTLLRRENEDVALAFLAEHPDFKAEGFRLPEYVGDAREGMLTLWPHRQGTDGFFISKLHKEG